MREAVLLVSPAISVPSKIMRINPKIIPCCIAKALVWVKELIGVVEDLLVAI